MKCFRKLLQRSPTGNNRWITLSAACSKSAWCVPSSLCSPLLSSRNYCGLVRSSDMLPCQRQFSNGTLKAVDDMESKSWVTNIHWEMFSCICKTRPHWHEFTADSHHVSPSIGTSVNSWQMRKGKMVGPERNEKWKYDFLLFRNE